MDVNQYRKCGKCGQIESIYKKLITRPFRQLLPNKFYICDNENCVNHISLAKTEQLFSWVECERFMWLKVFGKGMDILSVDK